MKPYKDSWEFNTIDHLVSGMIAVLFVDIFKISTITLITTFTVWIVIIGAVWFYRERIAK